MTNVSDLIGPQPPPVSLAHAGPPPLSPPGGAPSALGQGVVTPPGMAPTGVPPALAHAVSAPPPSAQGTIHGAAAGGTPGEDEYSPPKKITRLSDIRFKAPLIDDASSGYELVIDRVAPKTLNGMKADGNVFRQPGCWVNGDDFLEEETIRRIFGPGTYKVWVEAPSPTRTHPTTGQPIKFVKAEGVINIANVTSTMQQPAQPQMAHPGYNPAQLEQVKTEGRVMEKLADATLARMGQPVQPATASDGTAAIAASAVQANKEMMAEMLAVAREENAGLRNQLTDLQRQINELLTNRQSPDHGLMNALVETKTQEVQRVQENWQDRYDRLRDSLDSRMEEMRRSHASQIQMMQDAHNRAMEQQQRSYEDRLDRARDSGSKDFDREREHAKTLMESLKNDHHREVDAIRGEHQRVIENLRNDHARDLAAAERTQKLILDAKEVEIQRLSAEATRYRDRCEQYEKAQNKPLHIQMLEMRKFQELMEEMAGGREVTEEKVDRLSQLITTFGPQVSAIAGPLLQMAMMRFAPAMAGAAGAGGVASPPQLPPGSPPQQPRGASPPPPRPEQPTRPPKKDPRDDPAVRRSMTNEARAAATGSTAPLPLRITTTGGAPPPPGSAPEARTPPPPEGSIQSRPLPDPDPFGRTSPTADSASVSPPSPQAATVTSQNATVLHDQGQNATGPFPVDTVSSSFVTRGPVPDARPEMMAEFMNKFSSEGWSAYRNGVPGDAFAVGVISMIPPVGVKRLVNWIDAPNAALMLDEHTKGAVGWADEGPRQWLIAVWDTLEKYVASLPS